MRQVRTCDCGNSEGVTWKCGLLLDERESSYPDDIQSEVGTLFNIQDHQPDTLNRADKWGVGSVRIAVSGEEANWAARSVSTAECTTLP